MNDFNNDEFYNNEFNNNLNNNNFRGGFGNDFSDECVGEFCNVQEILDRIDSLPICCYFMETRKRAKFKSTVSWLEVCDEDTINLILHDIKEIRQNEQMTMTENEQAKENKTEDLFDNPQNVIERNMDLTNKGYDIKSLVALLLAWENDKFEVLYSMFEPALIALVLYATVEIDRRKGDFKINGNGTLLSKTTKIELTPKGKKRLETIKKG